MKTVKKMQMGGMSDGSMMQNSMMKKGGAVKAVKKTKMATGGAMKDVPANKKGLAKLPTEVRNKMGFKKNGGSTDPKMKMGGAMKGKKC